MKLSVPKFTKPLTKFIRTGEGIMMSVFGVALIIIPIIQSNVPPALASSLSTGKWLAIATLVSRTGLKGLSLFSSQMPGMSTPNVLSASTENTIGSDLQSFLGSVSSDLVAIKTTLGLQAASSSATADPIEAAAASVTPAEEAAVQPPAQFVRPASAATPDAPTA